MKIVVTGAAGFIGAALCQHLLKRGEEVVGIDNLNSYYDVQLKRSRLKRLTIHAKFKFYKTDITDYESISNIFDRERCQRIVHLAAQAGVRYSIENPHIYVHSNVIGFLNILEMSRYHKTEHLVYASTSSVYGANIKKPFSTEDNVDHPVSLYAATKKSNELMAHCYSHLYSIPTTGLRFFTVYGPWGRPDMALFIFTRNILNNKPIEIFNYGHHRRDFTYIDDIVNGVVRVLDCPATAYSNELENDLTAANSSSCPYRIYNIGNSHPVDLSRYIEVLETCLGKKAQRRMLPIQPGDVSETHADISSLIKDFDYRPNTSIETGVQCFVDWYRMYYGK